MFGGTRTALASWSRQRELASTARAGVWSRGLARGRLRSFVKPRWFWLLMFPATTTAAACFSLLLPGWSRPWIFATAITGGVGYSIGLSIVLSGAALPMLGDIGEQWTADELAVLRRRGWRVIHHLKFTSTLEADHVVVGPGGVIAIETKTSHEAWDLARPPAAVSKAVGQARDAAIQLRGHLRSVLRPEEVTPLVILWSPAQTSAELKEILNGVTVLTQGGVEAWRRSLPLDVLNADQVARVWSHLDGLARKGDRAELERDGPPARPLDRIIWHWLELPLGVLTSLLSQSSVIRLLHGTMELTPIPVAVVIGLVLLRVPRRRLFAAGWLFGVAVEVVLVLAVLAALAV